MGQMWQILRRLIASREGNVAMIAGLVTPVIVGFCGLGGETAFWYFRQRDMQGAVDTAAYNGAVSLRQGDSTTVVTTTATTAATTGGWNSTIGTITVHTPPTSGTHETNKAVEVILTENEPRYFTSLFGSGTVAITTRAVAKYNDAGYACLLALDKTKSGAITFWGNTTSTFNSCNVYSDSIASDSFKVGGSANTTMPCALSVGGFSVDTGLHLTSCSSTEGNASYVPDPYASLAAPTIPSTCSSSSGSSLSAGKYCSGLSLSGNVTLAAGVYVVSGGQLKINSNANITGTGVTFYLTNGATVSMNGNATVNLTAPTTGTYSGVLMYGDRTMAWASNKINGTATSIMTGAIYFPTQEVQLLGNFSGSGGCMQVVADNIYYSGNSTFSTDCASKGMSNVSEPGSVALVE
jgi:Flp pilus assembly protein TadG